MKSDRSHLECERCKKPIKGKIAYKNAKTYHPECFKLEKDGFPKDSYNWLNKFYIHRV